MSGVIPLQQMSGTLLDLILYLALVALGAFLGSRPQIQSLPMPWLGRFQTAALLLLIVTLGAELGAKYAIASVWSADRDFSRVQFEKMCDLADKYGMKLNLEFVPFSNIPGLTEALAWMDLMDRPNVQVLVDTLHAHRVKVTPEQLREVAAERFGFVHLCDGPAFIPPVDHPDMVGVARGGRLYVGEGGIDLAGMLKNIPDPPYYSIELPNAAEVAIRGKLEHARRCLETAKTFFAAHQI